MAVASLPTPKEDQEKLRRYIVEATILFWHIPDAREDLKYWRQQLSSGTVYVLADDVRKGWFETYQPMKG